MPASDLPGIDVLFVGNSYTYSHDLPGILRQVADAVDSRFPIRTAMVADPDWTLQHGGDHCREEFSNTLAAPIYILVSEPRA